MSPIESVLPIPESEPAIRVRDLRKSYAETEAVRGIDLEVRRGEIFAFLGPNGAGKTTTVEILEGFRSRIAMETCRCSASTRPRNTRLARQDRDRPAGVRTRPGAHRPRVARALRRLLQPPPLRDRDDRARRPRRQERPAGDEPLRRRAAPARLRPRPDRRPRADLPRRADNRLRPLGTTRSLGRDRDLRDLGKTIFLTTHYMDEAERLADRIAVIVAGQIVAARNTAHARRPRPSTEHDRLHPPTAARRHVELPDSLRELAETHADGGVVLHSDTPLAHLALLDEWARTNAVDVANLEVTRPTLEDTYLTTHTHHNQRRPPVTPIRLEQLSLRHHLRQAATLDRPTRQPPTGRRAPPGSSCTRPASTSAASAATNRPASPRSHCQSSCSSRSSASAAATRPSSRTARRSRPQSSSCPA